MDVHSVRQIMRMKSIYEIPLRVTFYARVSSEKAEPWCKEQAEPTTEVFSRIEEIKEEINSRGEYKQKIEEIKNILLKAENEASKNMIDYAFINRYIDEIYVTP